GEQARPVERLDLDLHEEGALAVAGPLDVDHAFGLVAQALEVAAVGAVHRDAGAPGDEADHRVAGDRRAAAGELDPQVARLHALDGDAGVTGPEPGARLARHRRLSEVLLGAGLPAHGLDELLDDVGR